MAGIDLSYSIDLLGNSPLAFKDMALSLLPAGLQPLSAARRSYPAAHAHPRPSSVRSHTPVVARPMHTIGVHSSSHTIRSEDQGRRRLAAMAALRAAAKLWNRRASPPTRNERSSVHACAVRVQPSSELGQTKRKPPVANEENPEARQRLVHPALVIGARRTGTL